MSDAPPARLSRATLAALPPSADAAAVTRPRVDQAALTVGIVHFGIGAFHRSHQALLTEDAAAAAGETCWGILGVTGRSDRVVHELRAQDGLYGVLVADDHAVSLRLVGSVVDAAWPGADSERIVATLAATTTQLATLTITEPGYHRAESGGIDRNHPGVAHDIDLIEAELSGSAGAGGASASRTPLGLLARGLARRFRSGGAPFTVLSCDNLAHNGAITRELVLSLAEAVGAGGREFHDWIESAVAFPSSMVDRLTPATTERDRATALSLLGLRDEALVVAEPYVQWVIEDDFRAGRPRWELAGAVFTDDVTPYEQVKLRVLNATHSLLAWLGSLRGHATIAEAIADPWLNGVARRVLDDDILPTLTAPPGLDLDEYRDSVLSRFANPALAHATSQVAKDGSHKLPIRVLGTAADRLAAGAVPTGLALVVAAWIAYVARSLEPDAPELEDPLAVRLRAAVGTPSALTEDPGALVDRFFAIGEVFPPAVGGSAAFRDAVVQQLQAVRATIGAS